MKIIGCIFCHSSISVDDRVTDERVRCPNCKLLTPVSSEIPNIIASPPVVEQVTVGAEAAREATSSLQGNESASTYPATTPITTTEQTPGHVPQRRWKVWGLINGVCLGGILGAFGSIPFAEFFSALFTQFLVGFTRIDESTSLLEFASAITPAHWLAFSIQHEKTMWLLASMSLLGGVGAGVGRLLGRMIGTIVGGEVNHPLSDLARGSIRGAGDTIGPAFLGSLLCGLILSGFFVSGHGLHSSILLLLFLPIVIGGLGGILVGVVVGLLGRATGVFDVCEQ